MGHCFSQPAADAGGPPALPEQQRPQPVEPPAAAPLPPAKVSNNGRQAQAAANRGPSREQLGTMNVNDSAKTHESTSGGAGGPVSPLRPSAGVGTASSASGGSGTETSTLFPAPSAVSGATSTATSGGTHRQGHTFGDQGKLLQPEELLSDVRLEAIIGQGGYGIVMSGLWKSMTPCAVKLVLTLDPARALQSQQSQVSAQSITTAEAQLMANAPILPSRALQEAVLARGLSHPNVIRTFDVRSCQLSQDFVQAALSQPTAQVGAALDQPPDSSIFTGLTPMRGNFNMAVAPLFAFGSEAVSGDGYGELGLEAVNRPPGISWHELLMRLHARPGDYLTAIIMQHQSLGTLGQAIQRGVFAEHSEMPDSDRRLRKRALLRTAREVASGLEYLHSCGVTHGDLKPGNVLLAESRLDARGFEAQLSDFGLSAIAGTLNKPAMGTAQFTAPEVFEKQTSTPASDIYSFGILLFEMIAGRAAYEGMTMPQIILAVCAHHQRPDNFNPNAFATVHPQLVEVYKRCVLPDPAQRPSAAQLVAALGTLERIVRSESQASRRDASRVLMMSSHPAAISGGLASGSSATP